MDQFLYEVNGKNILVYRSIYAPVKSNMFTILTGNEAVVFDPNIDEELLVLFEEKRIDKVHILLTHGHYDHICGVEWLKENIDTEVVCHKMCAKRLMNSKRPLVRLVAVVLAEQDRADGGHRYQDFKDSYKPFTIVADKTFDQQTNLQYGEMEFIVTSTPGHSEGSVCYSLMGKIVFTGDTLLEDNAVITRFPGGNTDDYKNISLPYLRSLSKDTIIMPGHGDPFVLKDVNNI